MNSENTSKSPKRKLLLVRALSLVVIFATVGIFFVDDKQTALMKVCARSSDDIQVTLDACDTLIARFAGNPAAVSLHYRHKMRAYIRRKNWDAALAEVENAIAADPSSEVPWQWKALVLNKAGDAAKSLEALEVATDLNPNSHFTLKNRYLLLSKLNRKDDVDVFISARIRNGESLTWVNGELVTDLMLQLADLPLTRRAIQDLFFEVQKKLRVDPSNAKYRTDMLNLCLYLGPHCPPLFPERRSSYPKMTCDAAIDRLLELHPKSYMNIKGIKDVPIRDLFRERDWRVKVILQAYYLSAAARFERGNPVEAKADLILFTRVFHCLSGGKFYILEENKDDPADKDDEKERRFQHEHLVGLERQRNLVDLAHATPDE